MNVVVQQLHSRLYLAANGEWGRLEGGSVFSNPVHAISFCIQRGIRDVRLVSNPERPGKETYVYPFGQDPAAAAERKKLRRFIAESRRLARQKRMLMARIDLLRAEAKEKKKQFPFKRKRLSKD
jgi:hypothetical protein